MSHSHHGVPCECERLLLDVLRDSGQCGKAGEEGLEERNRGGLRICVWRVCGGLQAEKNHAREEEILGGEERRRQETWRGEKRRKGVGDVTSHASGNWNAVARRAWNTLTSAYVSVVPTKYPAPPALAASAARG